MKLARLILASALLAPACGPAPDPNRPLGLPDTYSVSEDTALVVAAPGVLANDIDPQSDPLRARLTVAPKHGTAQVRPDGSFTYTPAVDFSGLDSFAYRAADPNIESFDATVSVTVDPAADAPIANAGPDVVVDVGETIELSGAASNDPDGDALSYAWTLQGVPPGSLPEFSSRETISPRFVADQAGLYQLALRVGDGTTTSAADTLLVRARVPEEVPENPADSAPAVDLAVASNLARTTAFLYTGPDAIQEGVVPGSMDPVRAAVLRGRVIARTGEPLPGAMVSVAEHPEFGRTWSREDGAYDLAVNGGGNLTLRFAKEGFLPGERVVDVPWQDYAMVGDAALIAADVQVTPIRMSSDEVQVAQGSVMTDANGPRRATLAFMPGTSASVARPDGTFEPMSMLHIRASEYTVGAGGPAAMPGPLPPESAYTYAVELAADEAQGFKIEGKDVTFNQPIAFYVDNFRGFPVGEPAPVGYYDNTQATWVPIDSGVVVGVVGVSNGMAELDTDGDGAADNGAAFDVSDAERRKLATLFGVGQSFWRIMLPHLSTWDINWGTAPPEGAEFPDQPEAVNPEPKLNPDKVCHSIVECQNQVLGETIPVAGTPFTLSYRSDRVDGFRASRTLEIPISVPARSWRSFPKMPPDLRQIRLVVDVGGQRFERLLPIDAGRVEPFVWDGKDAYGRPIQGRRPTRYRIDYEYPAAYASTSRFGYNGGGRISNIGSSAFALTQRVELPLQSMGPQLTYVDARGQGLGAWDLDIHHSYDPVGRLLLLGDGTRRSAERFADAIRTVAGGGTVDPAEAMNQGVELPKGTDSKIDQTPGLLDVAVRRDGGFYYAILNQIFLVRPDGTTQHIAGGPPINGTISGCPPRASCGDGGLATQARLGRDISFALGPDESLYLFARNRIRRVRPDGIIVAVAGTGESGFSEDGARGLEAALGTDSPDFARAITVGLDGSVYFLDIGRSLVRRVGPDGILATVAGTGTRGGSGDGGPARLAQLDDPFELATGPDGSIYVLESVGSFGNQRIRRIRPDGTIERVIVRDESGQVISLTPSRSSDVLNVDTGPDGSLYVLVRTNFSRANIPVALRRISPEGVVTTIVGQAGTGVRAEDEGGSALTAFTSGGGGGVAIGPDSSIYFADARFADERGFIGANRIRRIFPSFPEFKATEIGIPSEDGAELYVFDSSGRHLRTLNSRTGAMLYRFGYDSEGLLASVTDGDDNITRIERDGSGRPTTLVGPFGQRTTLRTSPDGYLTSVTNPAGESFRMTYHPGGLLATFTDPRQQASSFVYDDAGRLVRDVDATGAILTLARADVNKGPDGPDGPAPKPSSTVSLVSALGSITLHRTTDERDGRETRLHIFPDGSRSTTVLGTDASIVRTDPDGTVTTRLRGPDPRFRLVAPIDRSITVQTPSGLTSTSTLESFATLPGPDDPLSVTSLTERLTVNNRLYVRQYDAASHTFTSTSPLGRTQTTSTDALGRTVREQIAGLAPVTSAYDARGRVSMLTEGTGSTSRVTTFGYASNGYLATIEDPLSRRTLFERDAVGRVTRQVLPDGQEILYGYDANGNVTSITPPGRPPHAFATNSVGLLTAYTPPAVPGLAKTSTTYTYDLDRNLTSALRPDDLRIDYRYDASGRLARLDLPQGYGLPAESVDYTYSPTTGQLISWSHSGGVRIDYTYDGFLLIRERTTGVVSTPIEFSRTYDSDFRLTSESVIGSPAIFGYDADGLLTVAGAMQLHRSSESGLLLSTALGTVSDEWKYNAFGEPTEYTVQGNGNGIFRTEFVRDALGRITHKVEVIDGTTTAYDYIYDLSGRLTGVLRDGQRWSEYAYDSNGNRTSATTMVSTPATVTARHDAQDRLLSYGGTTYTYTENGELRTKSESGRTTTYSYDALGNLRLVALPDGRTIEYLVDARGRRVGKKIDGVLVQVLVYRSQLAPVAEFNGNGKLVARFVYGTKVNVPEYMVRDGKTYRIISDHLGSPRIVVDTTSGDVVQRIDYDEWGVVVLDTNPGFTPFGFGGGILDLDTRLTRLGARDYDGAIGRWVAKDPIRLAGGANLYVYGMNSPISFNDLSGLCPKKSLLEVGDVMSDRGGIDAVKVGTRAASALLKALELVGFLGSLEFQVAKYSLKALVPAILAAAGTVTGSTDPATNAVGAIRLGPGGIAAVTASIGQNAAARLAPNAIGIVQGGALGTAAVAVAPVSPLIPLVDSVRAASRNAAPTISSLLLGRDPVR